MFNSDGTGNWDGSHDFTYSVDGNNASISNFGSWTDNENHATINNDGTVTVYLVDNTDYGHVTKNFTKQ